MAEYCIKNLFYIFFLFCVCVGTCAMTHARKSEDSSGSQFLPTITQVPRIDCRFVRLGITPSPTELFGQPRSKMAVVVARVSTGFRGRELTHNMWIFQHIGKVDAILDLLIGIFKVSFIIIYFVRVCEWTYSCHDTWMFVM